MVFGLIVVVMIYFPFSLFLEESKTCRQTEVGGTGLWGIAFFYSFCSIIFVVYHIVNFFGLVPK